ncbi:MAG: chemotaxis-specific protein-glutamate methyltransferase CheB [Vicinamibacterales bacterium]
MIRVAIADDSPFTCNLLASYIEEGGDCEVVGTAHDATSTLALVRASAPDVLTLDLQMPGGSGLDLLRHLADGPPVAIVVISGVTKLAAATTLHALELGAVDFVLKFTPGAPVSRASLKREILTKVKMAAAAKPGVRRPTIVSAVPDPAGRLTRPMLRTPIAPNGSGAVVIGASTGGPSAIRELLARLPREFASPCIIVQHLPATFTAPFAEQLGRHARIAVKEAESGDRLEPGRALVTPGASHLLLRPDGLIELRPASDDDVYRPSIDMTMISAAESFGPSAVGVILTGMGNDGADGLKRIRDAGGETYVQELASCVVASMPERAIERGGAHHVAQPDRIGQMLAGRSRP